MARADRGQGRVRGGCLFAAVLLVVAGYAHKVVGRRQVGKGVTISGSPSGRRDEHPGDGPGEQDRLPGADPAEQPADRHARGQRGRGQRRAARQPGHQHADPDPHLRRRAEGGRLLDPARRPWSPTRRRTTARPRARSTAPTPTPTTSTLNQHAGTESNADLYLHANQAGQAADGRDRARRSPAQHIDHFVEVNLAGFYYLAAAFGGIEVCIKPAPAQATACRRDEPDRRGPAHRHRQLRLQRVQGRLQHEEGRRAVPAPGRGAVAGVRPVPRHAARHRPGADEAAAGRASTT